MKKNTNLSAVGIIAEYNPFHNGHAYHIEKARELSGAEYCVVAMSGDFVQRGEPAVFDKYIRTAMALSSGADLVLELPSVFATSSAEDFASCGVALLHKLGAVTHLCFGSECGTIRPLVEVSDILAREPELYTDLLKERMKRGYTFPEARESACSEYLRRIGADKQIHVNEVLGSPNNILGVEYLKALKRRESPVIPVTLKRMGSGYHDVELFGGFASASGIRRALREEKQSKELRGQVPEPVYKMLKTGKPLFTEDFSALLNATLLRLSGSETGRPAGQSAAFHDYADVSEELEARIRSTLLQFSSFDGRIRQLKTRQYTYTRVSRALLHLMLEIRKEDVGLGRRLDYAPYARVLGFRRDSAALLTQIKACGSIPLITKTADAPDILSPDVCHMLYRDFYCSHIYDAVWSSRYHGEIPNEYNRQIVIC